jgi:hypothetical protein
VRAQRAAPDARKRQLVALTGGVDLQTSHWVSR